MRERPALGVLTGEPDRHTVRDEARERERLRLTPVDSAFEPERLATALELAEQLRMNGEVVRDDEELARSAAENILGHGGVRHAPVLTGRLRSYGVPAVPERRPGARAPP